ncbi:hypothetical protein H6G17_06420 [Chroococcidiopsis sp. FACHB-1243]|uniref:hypothetical protein n=1 Tax=Chroococcidiopsis sp. [FACHB-1243] TaxID=2692781 RepID=UPI001784FD8C|nr:hypothetical protein [Chroococcidiopsis sp. [FACHB-1243]]MBD2305145.1 hypothetical protein [Chroococcidiopsis sp. [FACHB-1243]]
MGEFKSVNREQGVGSREQGRRGQGGQGGQGSGQPTTNYQLPTTNYQCQTIEPHKRQNPLPYAV